ncbi:MAG: response regulator transcription factor [Dorea sp.]|jgi:DNA-binding response OmpR family regulator|nr:response regulator transcription factor [Dorea sp.]MCI9249229.1 response regulator transcription factor [Dorea sp.]
MRILIIEDDAQLSDVLRLQFEQEGIQADHVANGADAVYYALQTVYDVIILDRMLPGMDGLSLLKAIRENKIHTPVILATAVDSVKERIAGLNLGADDYIAKPYDIGELLARIRALTRRPGLLSDTGTLAFADLAFCAQSHELSCGKETVKLSGREALLMEYFLKNPGQTLPRQLIYARIWGPDGEVEDGNLDTYIYYLRKRLRTLNSQVSIQTVHGIGYRADAPGKNEVSP